MLLLTKLFLNEFWQSAHKFCLAMELMPQWNGHNDCDLHGFHKYFNIDNMHITYTQCGRSETICACSCARGIQLSPEDIQRHQRQCSQAINCISDLTIPHQDFQMPNEIPMKALAKRSEYYYAFISWVNVLFCHLIIIISSLSQENIFVGASWTNVGHLKIGHSLSVIIICTFIAKSNPISGGLSSKAKKTE